MTSSRKSLNVYAPIISILFAGEITMFPNTQDIPLFLLSLCCFIPLLLIGIVSALVIRAANVIPWEEFFYEITADILKPPDSGLKDRP